MFACLGHDAVVARHDQQGDIDVRRPRDHLTNKALMPRHIDDAKSKLARIKVRESKIDGDSSGFFLRQAVRIFAGQAKNESRFPMVDMAGGTD